MTEDISTKTIREEIPPAVRLGRWAALAVLALLALSLFAHSIIDTDIWWHLRTGRHIVETGDIPRADMYSYTAGGNEWIDTHWLFQVTVFGTHAALGAYGVSVLFILIFSSIFATLWAACGKGKNSLAALLFFWLALLASSSRFLARPEAFTYLMISIYTFVLIGFERGSIGRRAIFALIPLQALWSNMQGLFILGPFLILAYATQPAASVLMRRVLKREPDSDDPQKAAALIALLACSVAACVINPYGIRGLLFPFTLFTRAGGMENVFASSIAELQPPFSGYNLTLPLKFLAALFALSAASIAFDYRNLKLSHVAVFAGTGYLALTARRNVAIFALAILPIAVEHADNLIAGLREARDRKFGVTPKRVGVAAGALIVAAAVFQIFSVVSNRHYIADRRPERFGSGFKRQTFPHGAFVFIKENGIGGPFFNNMDIGGMFIWEMYPKEKAFIDARLEVNSAEAFAEYRRAMSDAGAFARLAEKHAFNAAVVSHTSQDGLYLLPILSRMPEWALVHLDPIAAVFVRNIEANKAIINEHAIDLARDPIEPFAPNDSLNEGGPRLLRMIMGRAPASKEMEAQNRFNLGLVFYVVGLPGHAIDQLEAGLDLVPSSPEGHYNLGLAYERIGRVQDAAAEYERTIDLDARHSGAHTNLGRIYDEQGLKEKAEAQYRRAIGWGAKDPVPLYNLGALYYERGDREAARDCWRRALKADPSFAPANEALDRLGE